MQVIPVDVARLSSVLCVSPPVPKTNPTTGELRTDRDGNQVYTLAVAVRQEGRRASAFDVTLSEKPDEGIQEGSRVSLSGFEAFYWSIGDRSGIAFRAVTAKRSAPAAASDARPTVGATAGKGNA